MNLYQCPPIRRVRTIFIQYIPSFLYVSIPDSYHALIYPSPCCGILTVASLLSNRCCGILAVGSFLWNPGGGLLQCCGVLAVAFLLWHPICEILAVESLLWNPAWGILAVESWLPQEVTRAPRGLGGNMCQNPRFFFGNSTATPCFGLA